MSIIEINNLTKYYGKSRGIIDVSLEIEEGEIFGFIGPNGAGKSTTIRTLLSLIYPTSGSATIFGKDIIKDGPEIRKDIGYLPSEVFYYENMKVIDLLNYSCSFYKKDCTQRIKELSDLMELELNRKIDDLSYGNKKKVGIIQGLVHKPKLIILDEPTTGLDPLMQQRFFDLLKKENEEGATILFSSHILNEVQKLCNRVAIIKEGRIVKIEKIATLKATNYKKIRIETKEKLELNSFDLPGVKDLDDTDHVISFLHNGDINTILKVISKYKLNNLWIEEPTLEEIFMHYYEREE
jgi:ABC-2 type transport system ATP-binding protein